MRQKLYLLPGTMCTDQLWQQVAPLLPSTLELVCLTIPKGLRFPELAETFRKQIDQQDIHLVGFSLGGYLATYFASVYPKAMAKLFVIANSPGQLSHAEMQNRQAVLKYVKEHDYTGMSRSKARSLLMPGKESEHALSLMLEMDKTLGETEFLSQYENTTDRDDLSEKIAFFDFPTHFYYSKHDALVDAGFLNRLADMNPNVTAIQSSTAGHMLPLQLPEELARLLVEWIETN